MENSKENIAQRNCQKFFDEDSFSNIFSESIGGNAGINHFAINAYYNPKTGEIKYFGNFQNTPEDLSQLNLARLRFQADIKNIKNNRLDNLIFEDEPSPEIKKILLETKEYIAEKYSHLFEE